MGMDKGPPAGWINTGVSILNGVLGDYLKQRNNPLAIDMALVQDGRAVSMQSADLRQRFPLAQRKLSVSVHGLCCSESSWELPLASGQKTRQTYGSMLQEDLAHTAFHLRYNTGLPIAENGKRFATLMQQLVDAYSAEPDGVDEIVLLGHSMGGLVIRSACDHAQRCDQSWMRLVRKIIYLGTPHHGADLEKLANTANTVLHALPNPITRLVGKMLGARSGGIKDLQHGHPVPTEWLASARHYLIAGTLSEDPQSTIAKLFGDALVRVPNASAEGLIPAAQVRVFHGVHHMQLAHDMTVYAQIKTWCESP